MHRLFQSIFINIHFITENALKGRKIKILKNNDAFTYKLQIWSIVKNFNFLALFLPNHAILVRRVNFLAKTDFEPCENFYEINFGKYYPKEDFKQQMRTQI